MGEVPKDREQPFADAKETLLDIGVLVGAKQSPARVKD